MSNFDSFDDAIDTTKTIRDAVHGDIHFDDRFLKILDTKEFQRLRRINQLSMGLMVFPSATHTRFSHCIGTYHMMGLIIDHLEKKFKNINIGQKNRELALLVALLHDIGHGPFSHSFEAALGTNHEKMTCRIIEGDTEINKVIRENFGEEYPADIANLISNNYSGENKGLDLFFVLKSLISSQLDADRLDYIVRDAKSTGVSFGNIDVQRIIDSIRVTEYNNKIYICILEKNILDIEDYISARYKMHEAVYYHKGHYDAEAAIKLIFVRVKELYAAGERSFPKNILKLISADEISLKDYISIDDFDMISAFKDLDEMGDFILSKLCRVVLYREKFERLSLLDNESKTIELFEEDLRKLVFEYASEYSDKLFGYMFVKKKYVNISYRPEKENIYVLRNNGVVCDIYDLDPSIVRKNIKNFVYIHREIILNAIDKCSKEEFEEKLNLLIENYNNRNFIEIERKFLIGEEVSFGDILAKVESFRDDVVVSKPKIKQLKDSYYDYKDYFLKNKYTLRLRENEQENKTTVTFKKPTNTNNVTERFEYKFDVDGFDRDVIVEKLGNQVNRSYLEQIEESLVIESVKNKVDVRINDIEYELSYDEVIYVSEGRAIKSERELELELKSNYYHRANLKVISDYLETLDGLTVTGESKYQRGMGYLKEAQKYEDLEAADK
ncbi:MAG: HD domain-containing protein [Sarcina sp.]